MDNSEQLPVYEEEEAEDYEAGESYEAAPEVDEGARMNIQSIRNSILSNEQHVMNGDRPPYEEEELGMRAAA